MRQSSFQTWRIETDTVDVWPGVTGPGESRFYLDDEQVTWSRFAAAVNEAHDAELSP